MDAERAEIHLRLMAEAGLRRVIRPEQGDPLEYVRRVRYVGHALAAVGALDEATAETIAADLDAAIAIRSREGGGTLVPHWIRASAPGSRSALRRAMSAGTVSAGTVSAGTVSARMVSAGTVSARPLGRLLRMRGDDMSADLWLLSLVRTGTRSVFSVAGWFHAMDGNRPFGVFSGLRAADDRGRGYSVHYSGGIGVGQAADGWLHLNPALPDGVRWVEFYAPQDKVASVRVSIGAEPAAAPVAVEPAAMDTPAERLVNAVAEGLLARPPSPDFVVECPDELVAALEAAGALAPDSPAVSRLAALCEQTGLGVGPRLRAELASGLRPGAELPEPWASVQAYFGRRHRPGVKPGIAPVTAVLPDLDEVRLVLAGLRSGADGTLLTVVAVGLPGSGGMDPFHLGWHPWLPWWIKDSAGQWHATDIGGYDTEGREFASLQLRLHPPLARSVTRLEVFVTGRSARVRASVPVAWVDGYE